MRGSVNEIGSRFKIKSFQHSSCSVCCGRSVIYLSHNRTLICVINVYTQGRKGERREQGGGAMGAGAVGGGGMGRQVGEAGIEDGGGGRGCCVCMLHVRFQISCESHKIIWIKKYVVCINCLSTQTFRKFCRWRWQRETNRSKFGRKMHGDTKCPFNYGSLWRKGAGKRRLEWDVHRVKKMRSSRSIL